MRNTVLVCIFIAIGAWSQNLTLSCDNPLFSEEYWPSELGTRPPYLDEPEKLEGKLDICGDVQINGTSCCNQNTVQEIEKIFLERREKMRNQTELFIGKIRDTVNDFDPENQRDFGKEYDEEGNRQKNQTSGRRLQDLTEDNSAEEPQTTSGQTETETLLEDEFFSEQETTEANASEAELQELEGVLAQETEIGESELQEAEEGLMEDETMVQETEAMQNETMVQETEAMENETMVEETEAMENETMVEETEAMQNETMVEETEAMQNETMVEETETEEGLKPQEEQEPEEAASEELQTELEEIKAQEEEFDDEDRGRPLYRGNRRYRPAILELPESSQETVTEEVRDLNAFMKEYSQQAAKCLRGILNHFAGMLCMGCHPGWQEFVNQTDQGIRVKLQEDSCDSLFSDCESYLEYYQELPTRMNQTISELEKEFKKSNASLEEYHLEDLKELINYEQEVTVCKNEQECRDLVCNKMPGEQSGFLPEAKTFYDPGDIEASRRLQKEVSFEYSEEGYNPYEVGKESGLDSEIKVEDQSAIEDEDEE
eukprot:CAMPEP_0202439916 /NCGR_PEP_ID=MMETSP1345-20130828/36415_1 /ASSEMBLY_ACC=CAM_ASM_000843 /TAXON_ID=342563 /ORGANISM="Fabrea Fabrea salina" /LENGTH=544 /DNA_ID=CAMNT_0049054473 /DNA_START=39 /DNA_END=1670 /DNA_ORIENTATION=+